MRSQPNIIVTGTPGVGKTTHCETLAQATGLKHLSINQIVKDRGCHEGWDDEFHSWIVDEDKLLDCIEDELKEGGYIVDWHACDLFPKSWIDLVVVLRVDSATLYDRLTERYWQLTHNCTWIANLERGYAEAKLQENIDSEIMEVILDEAREAFDAEIVVELTSNTSDEMESNVDRIEAWIKQWEKDIKIGA